MIATLNLICRITTTSFRWANNKRPGCRRGVSHWWIPTTKDLVSRVPAILRKEGTRIVGNDGVMRCDTAHGARCLEDGEIDSNRNYDPSLSLRIAAVAREVTTRFVVGHSSIA